MSRRVKLTALAVTIGVGVNAAAALVVDEPSDQRRRDAAERDVRAGLARRHVHGATVRCQSGPRCPVTRGRESVTVDPRLVATGR